MHTGHSVMHVFATNVLDMLNVEPSDPVPCVTMKFKVSLDSILFRAHF
jgi:hypothetical protein